MKKIILSLFVFMFTSYVVYADILDLQDDFSFDTPKRNGDTISYSFKVLNVSNLDNELSRYSKDMPKIKELDISSIEGIVVCDCKTNRIKTKNVFYDATGKVLATQEDKDFESRADEMVQELCKMY